MKNEGVLKSNTADQQRSKNKSAVKTFNFKKQMPANLDQNDDNRLIFSNDRSTNLAEFGVQKKDTRN